MYFRWRRSASGDFHRRPRRTPTPRHRKIVGQRSGADSRAAPCGASVRAAGGAAVVLERLSDRGAGGSTRGVATRLAVGPPARAHRRDEPDASPRRRSCRPSFAVAFEHRLAHRAQGKACVPLQPVQMPFEARDQRRARRGRDRAAPRPPRARRMSGGGAAPARAGGTASSGARPTARGGSGFGSAAGRG